MCETYFMYLNLFVKKKNKFNKNSYNENNNSKTIHLLDSSTQFLLYLESNNSMT